MKILTVIILILSLAACSSAGKAQPNYQVQPATAQKNSSQSQGTTHQQPLVKKAKKDPFPKNYYPVPHTVE